MNSLSIGHFRRKLNTESQNRTRGNMGKQTQSYYVKIINWEKWNGGKNTSQWFKLSSTFSHDPKICQLSNSEYRIYTELLQLAAHSRSIEVHLTNHSVAIGWQLRRISLATVLSKLSELGLIEITEREKRKKRKRDILDEPAQAPSPPPKQPPVSQKAWEAYRAAYLDRYGVDPIRNAKVNTNLKQLVERVGKEEAPELIRFFLSCSDDFLVKKLHPIGILLQDCETYHTRWRTGIQKINSRKHSAFSEKNQETLDWINDLEKQENKNQIERLTNGKTELQN